MFIVSVLQHIRLGDLSTSQSGVPLTEDIPNDDLMQVDNASFPQGLENGTGSFNITDERAIVRESTSGFAGK
jgi:proteasome activator subunit 4